MVCSNDAQEFVILIYVCVKMADKMHDKSDKYLSICSIVTHSSPIETTSTNVDPVLHLIKQTLHTQISQQGEELNK